MKKLALIAALFLGLSATTQAACDTKSLKGDYEIGVVGGNSSYTCAIVGVLSFDGKGSVKSITNTGCGGIPEFQTINGIYSLDSNCMGKATMSATTPTDFYFVLDKMLKTGTLFMSANNTIAFGSLLKQ